VAWLVLTGIMHYLPGVRCWQKNTLQTEHNGQKTKVNGQGESGAATAEWQRRCFVQHFDKQLQPST
jgi:hypothetical protein